MEDKILDLLIYLIFAIFYAFIVFIVNGYLAIISLDCTTSYSVLGDAWGLLFFYVLPIAFFIAPFVIKFITKCSFWKIALYAFLSVLIYILIFWGTDLMCIEYCKSFTPEKWAKYPYERYYMVDDLNEEYELRGMTRDELTLLLGKPEDSLSDKDTHSADIIYVIESKLLSGQKLRFIMEGEIVSDIKIIKRDMKGHEDEYPFPKTDKAP
ncbi:MAG: hypothetical protein IJP38_05650 [Oscillospiraceae bacterium]|nr:hypothetical protein [Oscillospiraceae bacterium]